MKEYVTGKGSQICTGIILLGSAKKVPAPTFLFIHIESASRENRRFFSLPLFVDYSPIVSLCTVLSMDWTVDDGVIVSPQYFSLSLVSCLLHILLSSLYNI